MRYDADTELRPHLRRVYVECRLAIEQVTLTVIAEKNLMKGLASSRPGMVMTLAKDRDGHFVVCLFGMRAFLVETDSLAAPLLATKS